MEKGLKSDKADLPMLPTGRQLLLCQDNSCHVTDQRVVFFGGSPAIFLPVTSTHLKKQ